jgi:hypothetical protein
VSGTTGGAAQPLPFKLLLFDPAKLQLARSIGVRCAASTTRYSKALFCRKGFVWSCVPDNDFFFAVNAGHKPTIHLRVSFWELAMKAALIILSGIAGAIAAGAVVLLYGRVDPSFPAPVLFAVLLGTAVGAGVATRMLGRD